MRAFVIGGFMAALAVIPVAASAQEAAAIVWRGTYGGLRLEGMCGGGSVADYLQV